MLKLIETFHLMFSSAILGEQLLLINDYLVISYVTFTIRYHMLYL